MNTKQQAQLAAAIASAIAASSLAEPDQQDYVSPITYPAPPPPKPKSLMERLADLRFTVSEDCDGQESAVFRDPRGRGSVTVQTIDPDFDDTFRDDVYGITHRSPFTESYTVYLKTADDVINCIQNSLAG